MDNSQLDKTDGRRARYISPYLERPLRSLEEVQQQRSQRHAQQQALREQAMAAAGGDD